MGDFDEFGRNGNRQCMPISLRQEPRPLAWQPSSQDIANDLAADVGQAEVSSLVPEGQAAVVDSRRVEDRCMKVVDINPIAGGVEAEFVGLAVDGSRLVAAALDHRGPSELSTPDDRGLVQHLSLVEDAKQSGESDGRPPCTVARARTSANRASPSPCP